MARNDFCVIGLGTFGQEIARNLKDLGHHIMVIESDPNKLKKFGSEFDVAVECDANDVNSLFDSGIKGVKTVIVAVSDLQTSLTICANLIELNVKGIIARARGDMHERILKTIGIPTVIYPERAVANRVAMKAIFDLGLDIISFGDDLYIVRVIVSNKSITNKTIETLKFKEKTNSNIMSIERNSRTLFPVTKEQTLKLGDIVTIITKKETIKKVFTMLTMN